MNSRTHKLTNSRTHELTNLTILLLTIVMGLFLIACTDEGAPTGVAVGTVQISVSGVGSTQEGFDVVLRNVSTSSIFTATTNEEGTATFTVAPGIYEASVSGSYAREGVAYTFNGTSGQITVRTDQTTAVVIDMKSIRRSQVVIKELYCGGCLADDGTTKFQCDKYVILYNNSDQTATLNNLCIGFAAPYNAQAVNNNYTADGKLSYETEGFLPVIDGLWYFPSALQIEPYMQVVVNIHGAIDNAQTISQSVSFANPDYYCMYDPESGYTNTRYYPTPSELIPSSHYLKAVRWSQSNAWPLSVTSPALVLFQTHGVSPADHVADTANEWYDGGENKLSKKCVKLPNEWVVDAIEVYSSANKESCVKRLTADVDAGYVWLTNYQGHSLYRNVDQTATESIAENEGKLVYNYALGVDGSTDPSGIDVEASLQRGARIVYQDTNNSSNDFHERRQCSLREN